MEIEEIALGSSRIEIFVDIPWHLYRNDPCWTPPLRGELLGNRFFGLTGLLTPQHPYHHQAEVTHFVAWRSGEPVGRVSASINHRLNQYSNTLVGFFGFWETTNDYDVASALLDRARDWVKSKGMSILRGPGAYSTTVHEQKGALIEGFEYPPTMGLTYNPAYYGTFLERYGFRKAMDYYACRFDVPVVSIARLQEMQKDILQNQQIKTRAINLKDVKNEARLISMIYNESFTHLLGFLPITDEEADSLAHNLLLVGDPGLIRLGFVDDEPAAVFAAFPDANCALRPRWHWYGDSDIIRIARLLLMRRTRIHKALMSFLGVRPPFRRTGIAALLLSEAYQYGVSRGYNECEGSTMAEANDPILGLAKAMGAEYHKKWRIYDLQLK